MGKRQTEVKVSNVGTVSARICYNKNINDELVQKYKATSNLISINYEFTIQLRVTDGRVRDL